MKGRDQTKLKGGSGRGRARLQREHDALLLVRVQARVQLGRQALAHPGVAPRGVGLQPHRDRRPRHLAREAHPRARRAATATATATAAAAASEGEGQRQGASPAHPASRAHLAPGAHMPRLSLDLRGNRISPTSSTGTALAALGERANLAFQRRAY